MESLQIQTSASLSTGANVVLPKVQTPIGNDACMGGVETELEIDDGGDVVESCWLLLGHQQSRRHTKVVVSVEYSMGEVLEMYLPG